MANKCVFASTRQDTCTDAVNEAGGTAYSFTAEHALAQYAVTGCINDTYYASATKQAKDVLDLCSKVSTKFVAQVAIFARTLGYMKDMPALLLAYLASKDLPLLKRVFPIVIDNAKMLRNFVQIIRSGIVGRRSLGSGPRNLVREWLHKTGPERLFLDSVGNDPSIADIIKMVHPRPKSLAEQATYRYLLGKSVGNHMHLPLSIQQFERFKEICLSGKEQEVLPYVPNVPFQMLTGISPKLPEYVWRAIAFLASWTTLRMNLNTLARHGVLKHQDVVDYIAARLSDPEQVKQAKVFPYQLLMAYKAVASSEEIPTKIKNALDAALEVSVGGIPALAKSVAVFPDVSGSMHNPITGNRKGATSAVRCVDVAALIAAMVLRQNQNACLVLPFRDEVEIACHLNPMDSVMTNASILGSLGLGGTNCSAPLAYMNARGLKADLLIYISDHESWVDSTGARSGSTKTLSEWRYFKKRNPAAKMVCIDLQAYGTTQAKDDKDILNIGGFSNAMWDLIGRFARGETTDHWVEEIQKVEIPADNCICAGM